MDNQSLVIVARHGVFFLLVDTMNKQIQVKYQSTPSSPYDTHKMVTSAFLVALFLYATASVAEVTPRIQESVYLRLVGNTRLFAGAFATVFLLVLLIPAWRSLLCTNVVHDEEASAKATAVSADSGAPTMYHPWPVA